MTSMVNLRESCYLPRLIGELSCQQRGEVEPLKGVPFPSSHNAYLSTLLQGFFQDPHYGCW